MLKVFSGLTLLLYADDKLFYPILSYGCEAWGFTPDMHMERLHLKYFKQILGVKQIWQNDFVYGELGRYPLIILNRQ